jgi:hypothetical protein
MMIIAIVGVMIVRVMTVHVIVIAGHSGLLLPLHRWRRILGHLPLGRLQLLSMMSEGSVWIDILAGRQNGGLPWMSSIRTGSRDAPKRARVATHVIIIVIVA